VRIFPLGCEKLELIIYAGFHGHVAGCYENEEGQVVFDVTVADGNVFFFFPPDGEDASTLNARNRLQSITHRWVFDPKGKTGSHVKPEIRWDTSGEFSRIDDRFVTKKYNHFWQARIDPTREYDAAKCGSPAGGLFNCLGHYTWDEKSEDVLWAGPRATFQEPTFIPKDGGGEGEGWIIALVNRLDILRNDIVIVDAKNLKGGPLAIIHLPLKLRLGLHGNFVDQREIEGWQRRREPNGEVGPACPAQKPLAWQLNDFA
jgi:carotenoid cleavage dioxygenase-like enzyme